MENNSHGAVTQLDAPHEVFSSSFCYFRQVPQFEQKLAPWLLTPQFGQKFFPEEASERSEVNEVIN
jgi:hypothetical protein